jgi:hypothetical protein
MKIFSSYLCADETKIMPFNTFGKIRLCEKCYFELILRQQNTNIYLLYDIPFFSFFFSKMDYNKLYQINNRFW